MSNYKVELNTVRDRAKRFWQGIGEPAVELPAEKIGVIIREGKPVLIMVMKDLIAFVTDVVENCDLPEK